MKQFIDKLISRLEELQKQNYAISEVVYGINEKVMYSSASTAYANAIEEINKLAEAYNNGWIPCEVRLPDNADLEYFLVWCKGYFTAGTHIGEECQWYGIGLLYNKNKWEVYQCKDIKDIEVIAWQSLPAPYKKGEEYDRE